MSNEFVYREIQDKDWSDLANIIIDTWGYNQYLTKKSASLMGMQDLIVNLDLADFTQVALKNGKIVGFIIGKKIINNKESRYRNKIKEIKRKILLRPEGILILLLSLKLNKMNNSLLKENKKSYDAKLVFFAVTDECRGYGVGKKLFYNFKEYLSSENISNFYVYTDSLCNYGFYEHYGLSRQQKKLFSIPFLKKQNIEFYLYEYDMR